MIFLTDFCKSTDKKRHFFSVRWGKEVDYASSNRDYIDIFSFYQKRALVMLSGSLTEIIATHSPLSARKEEKTQRISESSR